MVEKYDFYHGDCEGDCGRGCRADIVSAADGDYVLASDYKALEAERDLLREDLDAAAGELLIPVPIPGSIESKMLIANRLLRAERDKLKRLIEESFTEWQWCPKTEQLFRKVDGHVYHAKVGMYKRWRCFHNGYGGALFKTIAAFDQYIAENRSNGEAEVQQ